MFIAIVFIALGLFLLLNALGIIVGNFWGFFWAFVFIVIGLRMIMKKGKCPMCGWRGFEEKMHNKIHGHCCDHNEREEQNNG